MDQYATHQQALVGAVMRTKGSVVELGAGDYSTPILHEICRAQKRQLVTCDLNLEWLNHFRHFASDTHRLYHVTNWSSVLVGGFDVAFVDHSPGERRRIELERLRLSGCAYVVVHDTEPNPAAGYGLEPVLAKFKYRHDFAQKPWTPGQLPWTTVVSDKHEFDSVRGYK